METTELVVLIPHQGDLKYLGSSAMRLTLRTMLAYLDGILEPADRDEIAQKIEESEFARQLMQRLRECNRNPELAAPKVSAKTMSMDPNLVAEYLDNTLAGERVPEFEKACLESDVFMAEVAACHQILTMVLAQPAAVDLEMKQQMYNVPLQARQRLSQPEIANVTLDDHSAALPDDIWIISKRRRLEIPAYLRESPKRFNWKPTMAAALLLVILAVAITMALGPLDRKHPFVRLFGFGQDPKNLTNAVEVDKQSSNGDVHGLSADNNTSVTHSGGLVTHDQIDKGASSAPSENNSAPLHPIASETNDTNTSNLSNTNKTVKSPPDGSAEQGDLTEHSPAPVTSVTETPMSSATVVNPIAPESSPPKSTDPNLGPPPIPQPTSHNAPIPPASSEATHTTDTRPAIKSTIEPQSPATADVPGIDNTPLGRLLPSKDVVLLKFDNTSNLWTRVASGAAVTSGEKLLVLPTYRPTITLSAGITLQIPDETLVQLESSNAQDMTSVKLIFGRLAAITTGKAGSQIRLDVGGVKGVVTFVDGDATLGVEVHHSYPPGANPEVETALTAADLYAARGHLEWTAADGTVTKLTAPQRWELSAVPVQAATLTTALNIPKWIDVEQLRSFDFQASEYLAQSLKDDKPLLVALDEMVNHRKQEYKAMGAQCLAMLDEFEPLVSTFSDPDQRAMWPVEIASVKAALARGQSTAAKVHEAFVKQRGEDLGTQLFRMFLGYTKEQLQNGEAAKLVDFLDHDNLDCRVLAFANLQEITNKTFNYRPDSPAATRAQPLRRWQDELHNGTIVPRDNPQK
ncbi:MAG TPA: hypothetical protein VFE46_18030 [Pirellulales bacterium]|nr:hypothetical protein [Pirellulales bacterium]